MSINIVSIAQSALFCLALAAAQPLSIGIRAGVPLTPIMSARQPYHAARAKYTLGPAVELRLPSRLGIEADLLYKRLEYSSEDASRASGRWELPLILKYRFRPPLFAGLGVAFNRVTGPAPGFVELRHRGTYGLTAAVGIQKRFTAELRITHWVDHNFGVHDAPLRSSLDEIQVLAGWSWP